MKTKTIFFSFSLTIYSFLTPLFSEVSAEAEAKAAFVCKDFLEKDWGKKVVEEEGNTFLRIQADPAKEVQAYRPIKLLNYKPSYTLSMRVRYTDIVAGTPSWHTGTIIMHFLDAGGNQLKPDPKPIRFKNNSDGWVEMVTEIICPEGATILQFMPAFFFTPSGTLDIDDILLVPNES